MTRSGISIFGVLHHMAGAAALTMTISGGAFSRAGRRALVATSSNAPRVSPPTALTMSTSQQERAAASARDSNLFLRTPLIHSTPLTSLCGKEVYLKMDALQPSGSFKDRGMAHLCDTLLRRHGLKPGGLKLISSSGGNAGLAVTTVGTVIGMEVDVIVPQTTKPIVIDKLNSLGAKVTVHGANWNEADSLARSLAEDDEDSEYVSPYDNPLLWTGHSTLVDEIVEDLFEGVGGIIASVGGGGLLCGVFEGIERHDLGKSCAVIAAETEGAASFHKAFESGKTVRLESIDSIATSLGALEVTPVSLERATSLQSRGGTAKSLVCTDSEAVEACVRLANDHRILVEPACGAALAVLYCDRLREGALNGIDSPVVVEVCGGSGVNLDLLDSWRKDFL